ncbi:hypothetical protein JCM1840_002083 [Sporobolomyces johnsonii]
MLAPIVKIGAVASLASTVMALVPNITNDIGNGVHVPGAIPANLDEPLQHHLAFAGPNGMTVSWASFNQIQTPTVWYGTDPANLNMKASSNQSATYPTSRTYDNHVALTGLKPGTKYYYKVSYTNTPAAAYRPIYSFTTSRAAGDQTPFTMSVFADLGLMGPDGLSTITGPANQADAYTELGSSDTNTIQSLLELKDSYEFMHHAGDIAYADYALKEAIQGLLGTDNASTIPTREENAETYESLLEQFFDQIQPVTAEKTWMVSPGNHEADCDDGSATNKVADISYNDTFCVEGQKNFTFYSHHYRMPSAQSKGVENFWYSYDYGMAHFISLNTETDLGANLTAPSDVPGDINGPFGYPNQQIEFLVNDLRRVDRKKTPWVVVFLHRPWYTSTSPPIWPAWQQAFEKIFYDYGVDIYLTGHVHNYERFTPMFNGTIDPNGLNNPRAPWPILNGAAGHYDGLDLFDAGPRANGSVFSTDQTYGWGRLNFIDAEHLTYEFVASRNSTVIDSATLYKKRNN